MNTERCVKRLFPSLISGALVNESKTSTGTNSASTGTRHQQNQKQNTAHNVHNSQNHERRLRERGVGLERSGRGCCPSSLVAALLACLLAFLFVCGCHPTEEERKRRSACVVKNESPFLSGRGLLLLFFFTPPSSGTSTIEPSLWLDPVAGFCPKWRLRTMPQ